MLKIVSLWTEVRERERELCMGNGRLGPLKPEAQKATKEQGAQTQGLVRKVRLAWWLRTAWVCLSVSLNGQCSFCPKTSFQLDSIWGLSL